MKTCNKCLISKHETEFKKDPRNKSGLQGICKQCNKEWQKKRRVERQEGKVSLIEITNKCCNKCESIKPTAEFYKDSGCADGYSTLCKVCRNLSMTSWRDKNREKYNKNMRDWRKNNPEEVKDHDLRRTYGIGLDEYNKMKGEQSSVCAICKEPPKGKRPLVVDHNHRTGRVRGLLCYGCNRALHVLESHELLEAAMSYLDKHELPKKD